MRAHRRAVRGKPPWLLASCTAATACGPRHSNQRAMPKDTCTLGTDWHP